MVLTTTTTGDTTQSTGFAGDLTRAVHERLDPATLALAHRRLHRKAVVIAVWYLASFVGVVAAHGWLLGTLASVSLALAFAGVGFNIQHDANHNAFFDTRGRKRLTPANRVVGWSMFFVGADANRWIYRHGTLHHGSPNVSGIDTDIELGPLARFSPAQRRRPWHRYQHLYLWPFYSFTALGIMYTDVVALVTGSQRRPAGQRRPGVRTYVSAIGTKALFLAVSLGVPALYHPLWVAIVGALAVLLGAGFLLGIVFQAAHVVEEAEFAEAGHRPAYKWHEWQVRSSLDFSHGNGPLSRALRWYAGGLDHQTEHHLFPRVPHTAYPLVAPVVTEVCARYGIPRYVQPSFHAALASHFRHLRTMGRPAAT